MFVGISWATEVLNKFIHSLTARRTRTWDTSVSCSFFCPQGPSVSSRHVLILGLDANSYEPPKAEQLPFTNLIEARQTWCCTWVSCVLNGGAWRALSFLGSSHVWKSRDCWMMEVAHLPKAMAVSPQWPQWFWIDRLPDLNGEVMLSHPLAKAEARSLRTVGMVPREFFVIPDFQGRRIGKSGGTLTKHDDWKSTYPFWALIWHNVWLWLDWLIVHFESSYFPSPYMTHTP